MAVTKEFIVSRLQCGTSSGKYGTDCYKEATNDGRDPGDGAQIGGVSPEDILDDGLLGEGARVRVTVEVLDYGNLKVNPWWEKEEREKEVRAARVASRAGIG